jgi:hypothetical protein
MKRPPDSIETGHRLRGHDRVALRHQADAGAELERFRDPRRERKRDEGVVRVPILLRQVTTARPRGLPARRDMRVLGQEQRLEAALFQCGGQLVHSDAVIGGEDEDADMHIYFSPSSR